MLTRPAPLDGMDHDDGLDEFRVTSPREIQTMLKQLLDGSVLLNLNASDGSVFTSALWTIDSTRGTIGFNADPSDPALQALLECEEVVVVGYLDSVKLQFDLHDLVLVHGNKASVLSCAAPREMFRFQRRNTFRVRTIERTAPTASFRHPGIPDMSLALRVLDVSIGGCALLQPANVPSLQPGAVIKGVRLSLDADTQIDAGLMLHHVTSTGAENGSVRLGCEIVGMGPTAQRALQVYIDHTQKRRRMMSSE